MIKNKISKKFLLLIFIISISSVSFGQVRIRLTKLDSSQISEKVKYEGVFKKAFKFTDKLGDNIVILTESGIYYNEKFKHENGGQDAELFAYHFLLNNDSVNKTWKVYDFINDCPVDLDAKFIKNTFQVTDLNKDGIGEIWIMYNTVCHGDVSPTDMKIIMYQGTQKYTIRGRSKVYLNCMKSEGGEFKFDKSFNEGLKVYKEFATKLWKKNIVQN